MIIKEILACGRGRKAVRRPVTEKSAMPGGGQEGFWGGSVMKRRVLGFLFSRNRATLPPLFRIRR